ncbi:alpha/beta fold hydrolase [Pseudomonas sp. HK3]
MNPSIKLHIKGIDIHCLQWGNPSGPKVLALHGWLDNAESFSQLGPLLETCHVVAVDLPGHGLSGHWPDHQHYHLWAGVEDVEHILDALQWKHCHVIGHSMGAAMATLYAGTFPHRLRSLTLIEAIGPMAGDIKTAPERLAQAIVSMKKHNTEQKSRHDTQGFIHARMNGPLKLSAPSAEKIVERGLTKTEQGYAWANDKRLRYTSMMRLPEEVITRFIASITSPVLGVFATDGLFTEKKVNERWRNISAKHELHWLDGGHHLHLDGDVTAIASIIEAFFASNCH